MEVVSLDRIKSVLPKLDLIEEIEEKEQVSLFEAVRLALNEVVGAYAILVMKQGEEDQFIAARKGSPLVLGIKENEFFIASDISPIVKHTKDIIYLNDSEMAVINKKSFKIKSVDKDILLQNIKTSFYL